MFAPAGLHRRLAEDVRAALELAEKLIVEIVSVGQHHQRRVLHRRMPHHAHAEEEHGETLAGFSANALVVERVTFGFTFSVALVAFCQASQACRNTGEFPQVEFVSMRPVLARQF